MVNWGTLRELQTLLEVHDIAVPIAMARGFELLDLVSEFDRVTPEPVLLDMTGDEIRAHVLEISTRRHDEGSTRGLKPGLHAVSEGLAREVRAALLDGMEQAVRDLQPAFAEAAQPLEHAARVYGFTWATKSDDVIDLADEDASQAWRAARAAVGAIAPIARLRMKISSTLDLSPTEAEAKRARDVASPFGGALVKVNYSVAFAAGDNWNLEDGYTVEGRTGGHIDWLALAAGGLRLNTPSEVRQKIVARIGDR